MNRRQKLSDCLLSKAFHDKTETPDWHAGSNSGKKHPPDPWEMLTLELVSHNRLGAADSELQVQTGTHCGPERADFCASRPRKTMTGGKNRVDGALGTMKDSASTERDIAKAEAGRPLTGIECRRHTRHRLGQPIQIWLEDGRAYAAMAFEVSESGMSAATINPLNVGDKVDLSPVAGYRVRAIVRRRTGSMYGFEFVELTEKQQTHIRELCKNLPLFRSMLDI